MTLRATVFVLAIAMSAASAAAQTPAAPPQRPCENDPNYRKFDFWIGDWDVQRTGVPRAPIGSGASSRIERGLDGCVIIEHWTPPNGPAGKSFNIYNRTTKRWEQYWVNAAGNITHYFGEFRDDGNLYYEADQFGDATVKVRMTFFNEGPNQVRQLGHQSKDGGKTWAVTFDLTYVRKKQGRRPRSSTRSVSRRLIDGRHSAVDSCVEGVGRDVSVCLHDLVVHVWATMPSSGRRVN